MIQSSVTEHQTSEFSVSDTPTTVTQSVLSTSPRAKKIYDHVSTIEFPNGGDIKIRVINPGDTSHDIRSVGWATVTSVQYLFEFKWGKWVRLKGTEYKAKKELFERRTQQPLEDQVAEESGPSLKMVYCKRCIGVYYCDQDPNCEFTKRPKAPKLKRKDAKPPIEQTECPTHRCKPSYMGCNATLELHHVAGENSIKIHNAGYHNHPKPPPKTVPLEILRAVESKFLAAPGRTTQSFLVGTLHDDPITDLHDSLINKDRVFRIRAKALDKSRRNHKTKTELPSELFSFNTVMGETIIADVSLNNVTVMTPAMEARLSARSGPYQTDSIHGVTQEGLFRDINLTMTSGYDPDLERHVPMVVSCLFGMKEEDYKAHFMVMFRALWKPAPTLEVFYKEFPGMTCDLSAAEQKGFTSALREYCNVEEASKIYLDGIYGFCMVHYKRNVDKFRSSRNCPPEHKDYFKEIALKLTTDITFKEYKILSSQLLRRVPTAQTWLSWYQDPVRESIIYPVASKIKVDRSKLKRDTNAQEGLGSEFKKLTKDSSKKSPIMDTVRMVHRFMKHFEVKDVARSKGISTTNRKVKSDANSTDAIKNSQTRKFVDPKYYNDGVPNIEESTKRPKEKIPLQDDNTLVAEPEQSLLLSQTPRISQKGPGRPPGSKNKAPTKDLNFWSSFGIHWGISKMPSPNESFSLSNTCPLDTTLMAYYFLREFTKMCVPQNILDSPEGKILEQIVQLIQANNDRGYHARFLWCTQVMKLASNGTHDLYTSTNEVFHEHIKPLFEISQIQITQCSSITCPSRIDTDLIRRPGWQIDSTIPLNQNAIDKSIRNSTLPCSKITDASVDPNELNADTWRYQASIDVDTGEQAHWFECKGNRVVLSEEGRLPPILSVATGYGREQCSMPIPTDRLSFMGQQYQLAATILCNGSHFCCAVNIHGKKLLYDGRGAHKCRFVSDYELQIKRPNYFVSEAWYVKYPREESLDIQQGACSDKCEDAEFAQKHEEQKTEQIEQVEEADEGPEDVSKVDISDLSDLSEPSNHSTYIAAEGSAALLCTSNQEESRIHGASFSSSTITKRIRTSAGRIRTSYPVGFSIHLVANSGKRPICQGCRHEIDRGCERLIYKIVTRQSNNHERIFSDTSSYHLKLECLEEAHKKTEKKGRLDRDAFERAKQILDGDAE